MIIQCDLNIPSREKKNRVFRITEFSVRASQPVKISIFSLFIVLRLWHDIFSKLH